MLFLFSLISLLCSLSLFPYPSYATFMLTSSRTSVPKTQRSTLGNSTTLSLKKERYVNKKSSRHSAVKFVYLFTSFPLFCHTFQSALHFTVHVFVRPLKECWGIFLKLYFIYQNRWSAVRQSYLWACCLSEWWNCFCSLFSEIGRLTWNRMWNI